MMTTADILRELTDAVRDVMSSEAHKASQSSYLMGRVEAIRLKIKADLDAQPKPAAPVR